MMMRLLVSLLLSAVVLACILGEREAEASVLGGAVFRAAGNSHSNKQKPWSSPRRNYYYKYDMDGDDDDNYESTSNEDSGRTPCVGLCYLNKLKDLEARNRAAESGQEMPDDDDLDEEVLFEPLGTTSEDKPCVGICHYYRSLGIENPYEKKEDAKFAP
jgi:hypothetical protein